MLMCLPNNSRDMQSRDSHPSLRRIVMERDYRRRLKFANLFVLVCVSIGQVSFHYHTDSLSAGEITGKNNITMSWSNYQQAIIAKHHVQLVGWPSDLTFDIDGMSSTDLQGIIKGFKNCLIKWERTEGYMDQSESEMVPKRRQRSDKGKKRSTYRTRKQSGTITNTSAMRDATSDSDSSDSSSDTSSDSDSEDNE